MKKILSLAAVAAAALIASPAAVAGNFVTAIGFTKDFHGPYSFLQVVRDERLRGPVREIAETHYYRDSQSGEMKKEMTGTVYFFDRVGNLQKTVQTIDGGGKYPNQVYTSKFDWTAGLLKRITTTERMGDKAERVTEVTNFDHDADGCVNYYEQRRMYDAKPKVVQYQCIADGGRLLRVNVDDREDVAEFGSDGNAVRVVYPKNLLMSGGTAKTEYRYKSDRNAQSGARIAIEESYTNGTLSTLSTRIFFSDLPEKKQELAGFVAIDEYRSSTSAGHTSQYGGYYIDEHGNWKARNVYKLKDGEKYGSFSPEGLVGRTERKITYYK